MLSSSSGANFALLEECKGTNQRWFDRCIFELGNTNILVGYPRIQEFPVPKLSLAKPLFSRKACRRRFCLRKYAGFRFRPHPGPAFLPLAPPAPSDISKLPTLREKRKSRLQANNVLPKEKHFCLKRPISLESMVSIVSRLWKCAFTAHYHRQDLPGPSPPVDSWHCWWIGNNPYLSTMVPLLKDRDYSVNNAWSHFGGGLVPGRL